LQTLSLVLAKDGQLFLNGEPSDEGRVAAQIDERLRNTADLQVVISADKMAYHGEVIHLVDVVRRHGVRKFAINVEAEPQT
jgi:biopolymer transport protein ExbD